MSAVAAQKILEKLDRVISLPQVSDSNSPVFVRWKQDCLRLLAQIEGQNSIAAKSFDELDFDGNSFGMSVSDLSYKAHFAETLWKAQAILQSIRDAVVEDWQAIELASTSKNASKETHNKKVFVVHGHDEKLKTQVEQFLEKLELQPIILHKQPDQGQTIIEKFEKHSDVSFAIVLFTPDDEGRKKPAKLHWSDPVIVEQPPLAPRARQNVILEFGYFLGKLGRPKVCGLYCEGVELPSDYDGVLYTKVDAEGAWQFKLVKELKAAGFTVDANRLT